VTDKVPATAAPATTPSEGRGRRFTRGGGEVARLFVLAIADAPLVVVVLVFLFVTSEVWQFFGQIERWRYGAVMTLFLLPTLCMVMSAFAERAASIAKHDRGKAWMFRLVILGRVATVGIAVTAAFTLLGVVGIDRSLTASWIGQSAEEVHVLEHWTLRGQEFVLTEPLVRVASLIGAFAAFSFAVDIFHNRELRERLLADGLRVAQVGATHDS